MKGPADHRLALRGKGAAAIIARMAVGPQYSFRPQIQSLHRGGSGDPGHDLLQLGQALKRAHDWLDSLAAGLASLEASVAAIEPAPDVPAAPFAVKRFVLTENLAPGFPSDPAGTALLYILRQDGIGGWTVTWPTGFTGTLQPEIAADSVSSLLFFKESETLVHACGSFIGGIVTS